MTEKTRITQSDISAKNNAGRDIHIHEARQSAMGHLVEKFNEQKDSPEFLKIIEALNHYLGPAAGSPSKDLATKLSEGGRPDQIRDAERLKEEATKLIMKNTFSETAQKILVLILGELVESFRGKVLPLIAEGRPRSEIDATLKEGVITPAIDYLEANVLDIYHKDIRAMLFFLTGNCHIDWKA